MLKKVGVRFLEFGFLEFGFDEEERYLSHNRKENKRQSIRTKYTDLNQQEIAQKYCNVISISKKSYEASFETTWNSVYGFSGPK